MFLAVEGPPSPHHHLYGVDRQTVGSVPGSVAGVIKADSCPPPSRQIPEGAQFSDSGPGSRASWGVWCFCLSQLLGIAFSFLQDPRRRAVLTLGTEPWLGS